MITKYLVVLGYVDDTRAGEFPYEHAISLCDSIERAMVKYEDLAAMVGNTRFSLAVVNAYTAEVIVANEMYRTYVLEMPAQRTSASLED